MKLQPSDIIADWKYKAKRFDGDIIVTGKDSISVYAFMVLSKQVIRIQFHYDQAKNIFSRAYLLTGDHLDIVIEKPIMNELILIIEEHVQQPLMSYL
jgi:hypothetical protein